MNSKDHVLRLSALERELRAWDDADLAARIEALPEESKAWIASLGRGPDPDGTLDLGAFRGAVTRGRLKGVPDRAAGILTDGCLQDCIGVLGDRADFPSEADLHEVFPGLVERHGVAATRVMFAAAVLGDAPASSAIMKVLRSESTASQG